MEKDVNKNKIAAKKKGIVVSKRGDHTIIVSVDVFKTHAKYKKKYKSTKRYKVHDEQNKCLVGQMVEIIPIRPVSKDKNYKVA
jgi:small subunit ribosomal protein S17